VKGLDGPDLSTYLETRLNLLTEHIRDSLAACDLRYEQRFQASQKALDLGFAGQRAAVDAAFAAQKEAINAALAAADRAVSKAELATEKRFECCEASTPILCADLVWRPARNLVVGDELIACDEESWTRHGRRFRRAVVTANAEREDALFSVVTSAGTVRCNAQHPWLTLPTDFRKDSSAWRWVHTSALRVGDRVLRAADLWETDESWEAGWLAGMYDGEGCLSFAKQSNASRRNPEGSEKSYLGVHLTMSQRDGPTADRILEALTALDVSICIHHRPAGVHRSRQPFTHFIVTKRADVMRILGRIRPPRLLVKADGVWDGRPLSGNHRETTVVSVTPDGTGTIAALSTSTHTYIAGGFAMHNSVNEFRGTLDNQQRTLIPRSEVDVMVRGLDEKIGNLTKQMDQLQAERKGIMGGWGYAAGLAGLVLTLFSLVMVLWKFKG
jgi:hypothetical protein